MLLWPFLRQYRLQGTIERGFRQTCGDQWAGGSEIPSGLTGRQGRAELTTGLAIGSARRYLDPSDITLQEIMNLGLPDLIPQGDLQSPPRLLA